jgi:rhamnosyltransferase
MLKAQLVVPTLNAGKLWPQFIAAVQKQSSIDLRVLVIDSGSTDGTVELARQAEFEILSIPQSSFNHGGTRQNAVERLNEDTEFVLFMTQDAILEKENSMVTLLESFNDPTIACAYGRQLPHENATWYAASSRLIHYPDISETRSLKDKDRLGIKTVFFSNSFAAYRVKSLKSVGGFPKDVILGEDMYVCGKMLLTGFKVKYCANACVFHSHNFSYKEEFYRFIATGAFHAREPWLLKTFGTAPGEGRRTVLSQLKLVLQLQLRQRIFALIEVLIRSVLKLLCYLWGKKMQTLRLKNKN